MTLFRVFPFDLSAAEREPGGALFVPAGGKGRVDSPLPRAYSVLYAGSTPECAIAERFGAFDVWDRDLIEARPASPLLRRSRFALAAYELPDDVAIRVLDDAPTLVSEGLRPSDVVTRDRALTQAWAARIYGRGDHAGISWWSYYEPVWHSIGVWEHEKLQPLGHPEILSVGDSRVRAAARAIRRRLVP